MALVFIGIDPNTDSDSCPAVFVDDETGDLLLQGRTVTDPDTLAEVTRHSPIASHESVVRYEHEMTAGLNVASGEQVRWLPRRRASDLCLPGNDFWVLDGRLVRFGHFAGDGEFLDHELSDDPVIAAQCSAAFEAVWQRATDHASYQLA